VSEFDESFDSEAEEEDDAAEEFEDSDYDDDA
jgi:hypothetical protein